MIANSLCDLSSFGTGLTNSEVNSKTVGQQAAPLGVRILNLTKFPYDITTTETHICPGWKLLLVPVF